MRTRSQFSSLLASVLSFSASACQFETSPLQHATRCGATSGVPCTTVNAAASSDASTAIDFGPGPVQPQVPAPGMMQPSASVGAPGRFDAGASAQPGTPPPAPIDAGAVQHHPPVAVDSGPAPAAGDRDATTATLEDASADAAGPDDPSGAMFGTCSTTSDCASGLTCSNDPSTTIVSAIGYCMPPCDTSGWTGGAGGTGGGVVCPQPESGTVAASCQVNGMCMLGVCDGQRCPSGLACMPTTVAGGAVVSTCQGTAGATH